MSTDLERVAVGTGEREPEPVVHGDPAADPIGTVRDGGSAFPDGHPCATVNRYWIKRTSPDDCDTEHPWVALDHEADVQLMPNDLMDTKPVVPLTELARAFGHEETP